jgi:hypothetical protein
MRRARGPAERQTAAQVTIRAIRSRARSRASRCAALLAAALGCGCAAQPRSPFFGDERFLVLGVDPDAEADALARQLEDNGYRVEQRLRGQHFSALGAADAERVATKVRVMTARGIALALDAAATDPLRPGLRYALLPPPSPDTHDADADGFEEVFVRITAPASGEPCIQVYRVRDSGFVDPVGPVALSTAGEHAAPPWNAPVFCPDPTAAPAQPSADDGGTPQGGSNAPEPAPPAADAGSPQAR